jgi:hypothetical protein
MKAGRGSCVGAAALLGAASFLTVGWLAACGTERTSTRTSPRVPSSESAPDTAAAPDTQPAETQPTVDTEAGADTKPAGDPVYVLRDTGVRCVRYPCYNIEVAPEDGGAGVIVSDVDFSTLGPSAPVDSLRGSIYRGGLRVRGRIETGEARGEREGRVFRVTGLAGS